MTRILATTMLLAAAAIAHAQLEPIRYNADELVEMAVTGSIEPFIDPRANLAVLLEMRDDLSFDR